MLPHAVEFWIAFQILSEKRLWSETGPNPIQLSEIFAYVEYIEISSDDKREELLYIVSAMDRNFIEFAIDQIQKERKKQATKRRPK